MARALKDVPMQVPSMPEGLVAYGEGRDRSYVYAENVKEPASGEAEAQKTRRRCPNPISARRPATDQVRLTDSPACWLARADSLASSSALSRVSHQAAPSQRK